MKNWSTTKKIVVLVVIAIIILFIGWQWLGWFKKSEDANDKRFKSKYVKCVAEFEGSLKALGLGPNKAGCEYPFPVTAMKISDLNGKINELRNCVSN